MMNTVGLKIIQAHKGASDAMAMFSDCMEQCTHWLEVTAEGAKFASYVVFRFHDGTAFLYRLELMRISYFSTYEEACETLDYELNAGSVP